MTQILALLSFYYLCDQAAATRGLAPHEVARCMATYERMKLEFIDEEPARIGTPARVRQSRLGYRGFKAWEAANPDLVRDMRAEARAVLGLS
jgi:hypothetical protein